MELLKEARKERATEEDEGEEEKTEEKEGTHPQSVLANPLLVLLSPGVVVLKEEDLILTSARSSVLLLSFQ